MHDIFKRALTKTIHQKGSRGKYQVVVVTPSRKVVLLVEFAVAMAVCLSALEVVHIIFLHAFNSEIFSAIVGLIMMVNGVLIGRHA